MDTAPAVAIVVNESATLPVSGKGEFRSPSQANGRIVAVSGAMREVVNLIAKIAPSDAALLIEGEPGTGKRLVAQEMHRHSRRANGPFVRVACGTLRESEIDARLFGHHERAVDGADFVRPSLLQCSAGGTLFLHDLTELPIWAQVKLLDVLHDGGLSGGGNEPTRVNCRIIASVTGNVDEALARGDLSADLYYHLSVIRIYLPPLRHRQQDIRALAQHFLNIASQQLAARPGAAARRFSQEAWDCLLRYDWPGNATQLASVVAHAVVLSDGEEIGKPCIAEVLSSARCHQTHSDAISVPLIGGLRGMERSIIDEVIQRCRGNKAAAARALGLHRRTLYRILQDGPALHDEQPTLPMTPDVVAS
jgi:DNA-binding NtrC family response regulator